MTGPYVGAKAASGVIKKTKYLKALAWRLYRSIEHQEDYDLISFSNHHGIPANKPTITSEVPSVVFAPWNVSVRSTLK